MTTSTVSAARLRGPPLRRQGPTVAPRRPPAAPDRGASAAPHGQPPRAGPACPRPRAAHASQDQESAKRSLHGCRGLPAEFFQRRLHQLDVFGRSFGGEGLVGLPEAHGNEREDGGVGEDSRRGGDVAGQEGVGEEPRIDPGVRVVAVIGQPVLVDLVSPDPGSGGRGELPVSNGDCVNVRRRNGGASRCQAAQPACRSDLTLCLIWSSVSPRTLASKTPPPSWVPAEAATPPRLNDPWTSRNVKSPSRSACLSMHTLRRLSRVCCIE